MTDLFLIAHKVRGQPTFDVATQIECPECNHLLKSGKINCVECDGEGFWWIIPTSGHRAYPWWFIGLDEIEFEDNGNYNLSEELTNMPASAPDHYRAKAEPKLDLAAALGIKLKPKHPPIVRRI